MQLAPKEAVSKPSCVIPWLSKPFLIRVEPVAFGASFEFLDSWLSFCAFELISELEAPTPDAHFRAESFY